MPAFDWTQLIDIAEHLLDVADHSGNTASKEAYYRSCVNRSYYAVYKSSEDWLEMNNFGTPASFNGPYSHQDLIAHLITSMRTLDPPTSTYLNTNFNFLRIQRKYADYHNHHTDAPWDEVRAARAIAISKRIHAKLVAHP
jgi:hypothetical protein